MRNVFSNHLNIHMKYDLKGSTVDREASDKERQKEKPTFKDNDFLKDGVKIHIGEEAKAKLMETLKADVNFLTNLHVMDYSLLLGVHNVDQAAEEEANRLANQGKFDIKITHGYKMKLHIVHTFLKTDFFQTKLSISCIRG